MSNNTELHITHKTHRCWGASGDGRYEPLSQASDGLRGEKSQFKQAKPKKSKVSAHHKLVKHLWSMADF